MASSGTRAETVVIGTACARVLCPRRGDPADHTECLVCASAECAPEARSSCRESCASDADCPAPPCGVALCVDEGACLVVPDDASCPAGGRCDPARGCVPSDDCQASEVACADGRDDDCDGMPDCADPDCEGSSCSDGSFCNGAETCGAGACRAGAAPCGGACDEAEDRCGPAPPTPCAIDQDCGEPETTLDECVWDGPCAESAPSRGGFRTTPLCVEGTCRIDTDEVLSPCLRDTDGASCMVDASCPGTCGMGVCALGPTCPPGCSGC